MGGVAAVGGNADRGDIIQTQSHGYKIMAFIRAYWSNGYIKADTDPLKLD